MAAGWGEVGLVVRPRVPEPLRPLLPLRREAEPLPEGEVGWRVLLLLEPLVPLPVAGEVLERPALCRPLPLPLPRDLPLLLADLAGGRAGVALPAAASAALILSCSAWTLLSLISLSFWSLFHSVTVSGLPSLRPP